MLSEKEKMLRGELYFAEDAALVAERAAAEELQRRYNASGDRAVLVELLGACGEGRRFALRSIVTTDITCSWVRRCS
jgi:hypothetical protein